MIMWGSDYQKLKLYYTGLSRVTSFKFLSISTVRELTWAEYQKWFNEEGILEERVAKLCLLQKWIRNKKILSNPSFKVLWPELNFQQGIDSKYDDEILGYYDQLHFLSQSHTAPLAQFSTNNLDLNINDLQE